jgi:hypothetical protein
MKDSPDLDEQGERLNVRLGQVLQKIYAKSDLSERDLADFKVGQKKKS